MYFDSTVLPFSHGNQVRFLKTKKNQAHFYLGLSDRDCFQYHLLFSLLIYQGWVFNSSLFGFRLKMSITFWNHQVGLCLKTAFYCLTNIHCYSLHLKLKLEVKNGVFFLNATLMQHLSSPNFSCSVCSITPNNRKKKNPNLVDLFSMLKEIKWFCHTCKNV